MVEPARMAVQVVLAKVGGALQRLGFQVAKPLGRSVGVGLHPLAFRLGNRRSGVLPGVGKEGLAADSGQAEQHFVAGGLVPLASSSGAGPFVEPGSHGSGLSWSRGG